MRGLAWNIALALIWMAVIGDFSLASLLIGFGLGFMILYLTRRVIGSPTYVDKVRQAVELVALFIWELILANMRVAYDVITPRLRARPGVIAIPLDLKGDIEITLLANMITLTPGTLSLDVSEDKSVLYIHAMYLDPIGAERTRSRIKDGFERRIMELLR